MNNSKKKTSSPVLSGVICLVIVIAFFAYLGVSMGMANMLNTVIRSASEHCVLLDVHLCADGSVESPVRRVRSGVFAREGAAPFDEAVV